MIIHLFEHASIGDFCLIQILCCGVAVEFCLAWFISRYRMHGGFAVTKMKVPAQDAQQAARAPCMGNPDPNQADPWLSVELRQLRREC